MRKLAIALTICIVFGALISCAFAPVSSRVGEKTGKMYQKAYDRGIPSADQIVKAWPYVSGLIKGTFAEDYALKLTTELQNTVKTLDELSAKETLTDEDKGKVIGSVNRLEYLAGKEFKDKYGATIIGKIKSLVM